MIITFIKTIMTYFWLKSKICLKQVLLLLTSVPTDMPTMSYSNIYDFLKNSSKKMRG